MFDAPKDPEGLALAHRKLGYRAAYCPAVGLNDKERIREIAAAFAKHDVVIAEVGRWCNLLDADPDQAGRQSEDRDRRAGPGRGDRRPLLRRHRRLLQSRGLVRPASRTTSRREFFDETVENARKIIDAVKPKRAKFCYEMMGWALPDSPDSYLQADQGRRPAGLRRPPRPVQPRSTPPSGSTTTPPCSNECFDKLGPWIVSCHAKDLTWDVEMNVHFREVPLGDGCAGLQRPI